MSLYYLVKLEMLIGPHAHATWVVTGRNSRIYFTLTLTPKFARFESSSLRRVGALQENMHHWSERTETATKNGMGKLDHVVIATICQWRWRHW